MGLISLGSHDNWKYDYDENTIIGGHWEPPRTFFYELNNIDNVRVLDNESYCDNNLFVIGYTQSEKYYYPNGFQEKDSKNPLLENEKLNEIELTELLNRTGVLTDRPSILLAHAPTYFFSDTMKEIIRYITLVSCSHNHNLCVPPVVNELWTSTTGIRNPERKKWLETKNGRNTFRTYGDKVVINEPITTFSKITGKSKANILYPVGLTIVNLTSNPQYKPTNDNHEIFKRMRYTR